MDKISQFKNEFRWLSNFWPCTVLFDGLKFGSVEAAYAAAKTTDINLRIKIQGLNNPGECKRFGRTIDLRKDWDDIKINVMTDLIRQKFCVGSDLAEKLLATNGAELIEGNAWGDEFWGVCNGAGQNNLGKILMRTRAELQDLNIKSTGFYSKFNKLNKLIAL